MCDCVAVMTIQPPCVTDKRHIVDDTMLVHTTAKDHLQLWQMLSDGAPSRKLQATVPNDVIIMDRSVYT
eukprot:18678-Eustigmatos_ZCMA.PRE.1